MLVRTYAAKDDDVLLSALESVDRVDLQVLRLTAKLAHPWP